MKFCDIVWPFVLSKPFSDCLCHVSFSRYSPLSLEVFEKPNKCKKVFRPQFFREGRPQLFYGRLLARPTVHSLAECGWVPCADLRLRSLAMKENAEFLGVRKNAGRVLSPLWTKLHDILGRCRRPLVVVNALDWLSISRFIPKIYAIKFAVKLRSRPTRSFGPRFVGEGIPKILDMRIQLAVTSEHVADFGWVRFSELGD